MDDSLKMYFFSSGPEPSIFKSKFTCIRFFYSDEEESGYFHTFRTTNTRLFNNMVVMIKNQEEAKGNRQFVLTLAALCGKNVHLLL